MDQKTIDQMKEKVTIWSFQELPGKFWIYSLFVFLSYNTLSPFFQNLNSMLRLRFGYDIRGAGYAASFPAMGVALFAPIVGVLSDRHGNRAHFMILATTI